MAAPRPEARDLLVAPFYRGDSWGSLDLATSPRDPRPGEDSDLDVAAAGDALRQALLLRLLTPQGSLAELGHVAYGSRLHELIGELNTPTTRQLARSYTLRALRDDPRVESVVELIITEPDPTSPNVVRIRALVKARDIEDPLALGIEVTL
jgi:phage baseplate assembly protein W